jgi:hypothetical protein
MVHWRLRAQRGPQFGAARRLRRLQMLQAKRKTRAALGFVHAGFTWRSNARQAP